MTVAPLPMVADSARPARAAVTVAELHAALAESVAGELRFDRLSRVLYSTDASVYQIVPLGVVIPKTEADVVALVKTCSRFRVPLTARGGGTSQAGQAIGSGVILDFSKYVNRVLEINAAERWVRVEPGCVLDDLNLELKSHGLQLALDISTSDRATIGGMIANNSSGTRSLIYGKTVDHVLELKAVLADGSILQVRSLDQAELEAKCRQQDREGECYRTVRRLAQEHADEIERRYPKLLRRVGGYNLDLFVRGPWSLVGWHGLAASQASVAGLESGTRPTRGTRVLTTDNGQRTTDEFNLAHLLVGSEGTLGVTLEAKLRLTELPKAKALLVIQFPDLLEALAATPGILRHQPSAVEVVDKYVLDSTRLNAEASRLRDFIDGEPAAILIVEFYGDDAADLPPRLEALEADLRRQGSGYHFHRAVDAPAQARIWKLRRLALGLSMAEKGDAKAISFVEDTAVAPEHLRDYIAEFLAIIQRHGTKAGVYAHASVGCLHVRPVINLKSEVGVHRFEAIAAEVADLVLKYGGALSGEHGDGLVRSPFQEKMYGPVLYNAFRELKRTFDPLNIFNPGRIVDAPPLATNLRYGPAYVTPEVPTTFDFSADGGMTRAAELCAGVGECRKKRGGTMCPSYQATREEMHSTRGRANALRLALTAQLDFKGLTDPALLEVFDLCLECKACKSECPTNVDMARLKAEFLHQYFKTHGLPWRSWMFGNIATRSGSRFAPFLLSLARSRLGRWLNEKLLGIDRRRVPPPLASEESQWDLINVMEQRDPGVQQERSSVAVFLDTFTSYYEPAIGVVAARVIDFAGWHVVPCLPEGWKPVILPAEKQPLGLRCCGRPMISNGMLDKAVQHAEHNVKCLYPWATSGKPIISCEPSCILTIKDDYPALLRGELRRQAETVAAQCWTFEEFLESLLAVGRISNPSCSPTFQPGPKRILVQAHCHQRSLVGIEPTLRLLRRIPGAEVIDLDAGCCGMAGSFGYEKEHYEISRLVGEQRLFPAVRQADDDTVVVAPGFSCRNQIEHFTGRKALHPAQVLASLIDTPR